VNVVAVVFQTARRLLQQLLHLSGLNIRANSRHREPIQPPKSADFARGLELHRLIHNCQYSLHPSDNQGMATRKATWLVLTGLAVLAGIALWFRPRDEMAFLHDFGPTVVKITDAAVSPSRWNEASSFTFSAEKTGQVVAALREFAGKKRLAVFGGPETPDTGSIRGDPAGIYSIAWMKLDSDVQDFSWRAEGRRGEFSVTVFRNESALEVRLHALKRLLRLEK
jgi:hypothetical protein